MLTGKDRSEDFVKDQSEDAPYGVVKDQSEDFVKDQRSE